MGHTTSVLYGPSARNIAPDRALCARRMDARRDCVRLSGVEAEVRYAEVAGDYFAYSVFGNGPIDLAIAQSRFPIDLMWDLPQLATFMEALGNLARVIVWD